MGCGPPLLPLSPTKTVGGVNSTSLLVPPAPPPPPRPFSREGETLTPSPAPAAPPSSTFPRGTTREGHQRYRARSPSSSPCRPRRSRPRPRRTRTRPRRTRRRSTRRPRPLRRSSSPLLPPLVLDSLHLLASCASLRRSGLSTLEAAPPLPLLLKSRGRRRLGLPRHFGATATATPAPSSARSLSRGEEEEGRRECGVGVRAGSPRSSSGR